MRLRFLYLPLLFISFMANSQWYETQGHAFVDHGNTETARTKAMENALKKALLVAGASVSSVQQVVNGLLTQDKISIRASGTVNSIELVSETYIDGVITVKIRADIFPQEEQCFAADFQKSLLITKSNLLNREQASIGDIYAIDTAIMETLAKKLRTDSQHLLTKLALKSKTEFSRLNDSMADEKIKQLTTVLADQTNSQYILYSEISDVSFGSALVNDWKFWQQDVFDRHFGVSMYLYNGDSGERVTVKQYQNFAPWGFNIRDSVDLKGNAFWQSDYGHMVDNILTEMVADLEESLMCETTQGKIVRVEGNEIMFNLGSNNGVKVGDEFSLVHQNSFNSDAGITYPSFNVSPFEVKVTKLTRASATAITTNGESLGNIQINDLVVRH